MEYLSFAAIMAPADQQWWWYPGATGQQVGQLLAQNKARLTALTPVPAIPRYTFSLDSFEIRTTRSGSIFSGLATDTDYVTFGVAVGGGQPQLQTKSMGDLGKGTFSVGLMFGYIAVADFEPVIVNYLIVNSSQGPSEVDAYLKNATTQLANAGVKAAADAIAAGAGALAGAAIGGVVVPILGSALGALGGWLISEVWRVLWPDCDGPVATRQTPFLGRDLWLKTAAGPLRFSTEHPGIDSPPGCGANSDYVVNWSITRA
jgi:hypothetical protein